MKPWAEHFYRSAAWTNVRDAYFLSRHGLCERCEGVGKIVHHKTWLTPENINDPNITLSWDNLELLCQDCHNKVHMSNGSALNDNLMCDEFGDIVERFT